jgi:integral membrane sensor domain MASE1
MWATIKRFAAIALAGAIVGAILASIIAPHVVNWYNTPGSTVASMCDCAQLAAEVASRMLWAQFTGAVIGAVLFIVVGVIVVRSRKAKAAPPAASTTPPAAPSVGA